MEERKNSPCGTCPISRGRGKKKKLLRGKEKERNSSIAWDHNCHNKET